GREELERLLVQRDRLGRPTGGPVGRGEVVAADQGVAVVGAELRRPQLQRLVVERDRLGGTSGGPVGRGEVVAAVECVRVVGSENLLPDPAGLGKERDCLVGVAKVELSLAEDILEPCYGNRVSNRLAVELLAGPVQPRAQDRT